MSAVGFEFDVPARWNFSNYVGKVQAQLWAGHSDGNVLLIEVKCRNVLGQPVKVEFSVFPIVKEYTSGRALIPGSFTEEEARLIAKRIMMK